MFVRDLMPYGVQKDGYKILLCYTDHKQMRSQRGDNDESLSAMSSWSDTKELVTKSGTQRNAHRWWLWSERHFLNCITKLAKVYKSRKCAMKNMPQGSYEIYASRRLRLLWNTYYVMLWNISSKNLLKYRL